MAAISTLMKTLSSFNIESIDRAYIGLIGGLIGSLSTFFLSGWRQWRIEKRQAYAAQLMLTLEIEQNLGLIKDYWIRVNQNESINNGSELYVQRLNHLMQLPMSEFNSHIWRSHTLLFGSTMEKNEIKQIQYFYKNLYDIKIIYSNIVDSGKEDLRIFAARRFHDVLKTRFMTPPSVSPSSWMEFETLVCRVLEEGNPIKDNLFARYFKIS